MPVGFQVFNPDGTLQFDTSNFLYRIQLVLKTGTVAGSAAIPAGVGNAVVTVVEDGGTMDGFAPQATISGGTVSWDFGDLPAHRRSDSYLMVEVY